MVFFVLFMRKHPYFICGLLLFVQVGKQHRRKNSQKQPFTHVLQNSCSSKFFFVKKTAVLESPFNKVAGLKVSIFIKKKTPTQLFFCEYCEILKNSFL